MKKLIFVASIAMALGATSCKNDGKVSLTDFSKNPFATESTLEYSAPDFTKITDADYLPAFNEGFKQQNEAIKAIVENTEAPTFENTILALEKSNVVLERVSNVFYGLTGFHTNETLKEIQTEISPRYSEHGDNINLNTELFKRVKAVYDNLDKSDLDEESKVLVKETYKGFVKAGANLSDDKKEELKKINSEIATLTNKFNQTLQEAGNQAAVIVTDKAELAGLTESQIKGLKVEGKEEYKISILNTTQQPLLQNLENRALREKLFKASINRAKGAENNTKDIIKKLVKLRAQKGELLGFPTYADWSLQGTMVKTPQKVKSFFSNIVPSATSKAGKEAAEIQAMIKKTGGDFTLEPWDWNYYAEKVRKEKYDLDESAVKPYFELKSVLENGVFFAANKLYGITFKERTDIPTYHPDVLVYELFEEDGSKLGLFYADYYARPSKRGGAWMSNFVTQSKLYNKKPVIYNICNYTKPAEGEPALITFDNVTTMFHEFGHALHGFFANQQYPSLSGTAVARDFVEFPSQVNENWALHPEVLANYAKHYKTGEKMPKELIQKIKNASTFNQGYSLTETISAGNLDMEWHTIKADQDITDVDQFQKEALHRTKCDAVNAVQPRYNSTYFAHIFSGGYAAGYYSYTWTEMLHHDAYQGFEATGGLTRENGQRFRDMVLSQGNTKDYETMYRNWRGADPKIDGLEKARGLK